MALKVKFEFWVVTLFSVVGYQRFGGPCCLHLYPECGGSMVLRNAGILPQHYNASQPRRTRTEAIREVSVLSARFTSIC
jgi:hypothetical protein